MPRPLPPPRPLLAAVPTAPWPARAPASLLGLLGSPGSPACQAPAVGPSRAPSKSSAPAYSARASGQPSCGRTTRTREARFFSSTVPAGAKPRKGDGVGAPKKLLGRPSNSLKIGVVGMPNVGKSTIFNVVTSSKADAENFPFCTIDPQEARVAVPDVRFEWLCSHYKPQSKIPAYLTVIDIAGLVKGASRGEGLGNEFLANIKAVDGLFHVVRAFEDDTIAHVEGSVNPIRDMEIIHTELRLKDEEALVKTIADLTKLTNRIPKTSSVREEKLSELKVAQKLLKRVGEVNKDVRTGDWTNNEIDFINTLRLLTAKPLTYLVNVSADDYVAGRNRWIDDIRTWVAENGTPEDEVILFSAALETELAALDPESREAKCAKLKATTSLPAVIKTGYKAMNLIYFFTVGEKQVRAWTIRSQTKAPQAAGVVHSDFEKAFIAVDVTKFADLQSAGSDEAVKGAGKVISKGKDYAIEDGDIVVFKLNGKVKMN